MVLNRTQPPTLTKKSRCLETNEKELSRLRWRVQVLGTLPFELQSTAWPTSTRPKDKQKQQSKVTCSRDF